MQTLPRLLVLGTSVAVTALGAVPSAAATTTPASSLPASSAAPTGGSAVCDAVAEGRIDGLGTPDRATVVLADDYGTSHATLTECVRSGSGYEVDYSVDARIGREGFAPDGAKREGDGRSPSGVYSFGHGFGGGDPGSTTGYREITDRSCWVDQPGSDYNTWQETDDCRGEQLADYVEREYAQGIVVDYNTDEPVAGMGSAIFLHASGDGATAGCVSVAEDTVTRKMRNTGSGDRIIMGVAGDMITD